MSFENFPYTNFHDLNLDWIIKKLKECYSPDNPPESVVLSVNGESGIVVLYTDAIVRLPDVEDSSWNIHRLADGSSEGVEFTKNQPAKRINGTNRYEIYDAGNPPPYPVRSVNGQTGNVVVSVPVQSVNGQTGVITLYQNAQIAFPNVEAETWNMYRGTGEQGTITGIQFTTGEKATRIDGTHRYDIYDEGNPPPYPVTSVGTLTGAVAILDTSIVTDGGTQKIKIAFPVTSVDGATGAVTTWGASGNGILQPPVAAQGDIWGFKREIVSGDIGITFEYDDINDAPAGYIVFNDGTNPQVKLKILTPDDIPASAGVISFNGQSGVITCTGADLAVSSGDATKIDTALAGKATKVSSPTAGHLVSLTAAGDIADSGKTVNDFYQLGELTFTIIGNTSATNIGQDQYVTVINSTITGITDGEYKATNVITANTPVTSSDLEAVTNGAVNNLLNVFKRSYAVGEIASGTLTANNDTEFTVNFGKTLSSTPVVVANVYSHASSASLYVNDVTDITTTGFKIKIHNPTANDVNLSANRRIAWVARC